MEAEVQGYLTELGILRGQLREAIRGLNDEAANWRPLLEGTNSICAIFFHLIGVDNYWVRQVIGGEAIQRDRAAEFQASGRLSEFVSRWEKVATEAESILGKLSLAQLAETRTVPARPEWGAVAVRWCILHLISHHAIHLGHIHLTRQLQREGPPHYQRLPRPNPQLEPYREFTQELRGQGLIGSRILRELRQRGYEGSQASFYCYLRALKKEDPDPRVCLRYETAPGQQGQFDWSHYTVDLGGMLSRVVVFGLVLGYSRRKHYWASLDETQGSIYEAIEEGFWHFGGATKELLIDNARAFVLNAAPGHFQWNPHFLELCGYYGVQPIACQVGKPRGKGKVEKPFSYLEEQFIKGGQWRDFVHFCQELARFEGEELDQMVHHTTQERPIDRFQQEQPYLLPLPATRFVGIREQVRQVNWDCLLSFGGNKYSVPHVYAGKLVWVRTSQGGTLQVYNQKRECVATHSLNPGKGAIIMEKAHYAGLRQQTPRTRILLKQAFLERFPGHWLFLEKLCVQQRLNPESHIRGILQLASLYPAEALEEAFTQAQEYNTFSQSFVRGLLEGKAPVQLSSSPSALSLRAVPTITVKGDLKVYQGILELWKG